MTKLKTLKDIDSLRGYPDGEKTGLYAIGNLQDAAREWVKIFKEDLNRWFRRVENAKNDTDRNDYMTQCDILIDKMQWIEYFFNLDE